MLRPRQKIYVGENLVFDFVHELEITSTWDSITDSGFLKLPTRFKKGGQTLVAGKSNLFKRGDELTIEAGYYPNLQTLITGYVSGIIPDSPMTLSFQDEAYKFKGDPITDSFEKISLRELLNKHSPTDFKCVDAELGAWRITRANFAQILDELRETYGLVSFCREGVLYCGLAYWPELTKEHTFKFEKQVISNDLEYLREDDVAIKVKGISIMPDNSRIEVEAGDPHGSQKTLHFYNLTKDQLTEAVNRELPRLKYEGYRGSFTTFGEPTVFHGDIVNLVSIKFPERDGAYYVDAVTYTQSTSDGYRQRITLGPKAK